MKKVLLDDGKNEEGIYKHKTTDHYNTPHSAANLTK